jgi:heptosyltransferase II
MKLPSSEQCLFAANILVNKLFFKKYHHQDLNRILVVKLDEIGDMATATHVFEILKKSYPNARLTILCKPFINSMLQDDPFVDELSNDVDLDFSSFQLVVELRGTWQTLFKAVFSKVKYRLSRAEVRFRNKGNQLHEVETNYEVIKPILKQEELVLKPILYFSERDINFVNDFLESNNINKFSIFHVGARRKLRQWPLDRFAFVADYLFQKGYQIVFVGTADEEKEINEVKGMMKNPSFSLTSQKEISILSALCSKASYFIGNESGPLHVVASFDVPLIGLYGPGVPNVFYPYSPKSQVLHHVLECNPCDQIHCSKADNPCINRIQVLDVIGLIH